MTKNITFVIIVLSSLILISGTIDLNQLFDYENQSVPNYITKDNTPNANPITDGGATLGRVLFYDKNLSLNNTISCASCHKQALAFGDNAALSIGWDGNPTGRHSPRLINARFGEEERFFWDERANSLEEQTTMPIEDHIEMGFSGQAGNPTIDSLIDKLETIDYYQDLFTFVYGDFDITEAEIQDALAQFIRSIQSFDSKYDIGRAQVNNNNADFPNFTEEENLGKTLFMNSPNNGGANCNTCHSAPEFDIDNNSDNNSVITVAGNPGAIDLSNTRSPTLRDMVNPDGTLNGPLMHDGSFTSLMDVINLYDDIDVDPANTNLDNRLQGGPGGNGQNLNLSQTEKNNLVAFLETLTGTDVYTAEQWSDPFDQNGDISILNSPLPVEITHFNLETLQEQIQLYWKTADETNNMGFEIQHSTNAIDWNNVDFIPAGDYTSNIYQYLHESPSAGINYYRLKQLDFDGKKDYSQTLSIQYSKASLTISMYPNPVQNYLKINLNQENFEAQLIQMNGQILENFKLEKETEIDLSQYNSGTYFIRITDQSGKQEIRKIIKL